MISLEKLLRYAQKDRRIQITYPFDEQHLVLKLAGNLFLICDTETMESFVLKNKPYVNIALRREYPNAIKGGFHMNKNHWNTLSNDGQLSEAFLWEQIEISKQLVFEKLPKAIQKMLNENTPL